MKIDQVLVWLTCFEIHTNVTLISFPTDCKPGIVDSGPQYINSTLFLCGVLCSVLCGVPVLYLLYNLCMGMGMGNGCVMWEHVPLPLCTPTRDPHGSRQPMLLPRRRSQKK